MKIIAPAFAALCLMTTNAYCQELTREQTLTEVSRRIAEINKTMPSQTEYATGKTGFIQDRIDEALKQVAELRDYLSTNKYVRVSGASVSIPPSISVELTFPEPDK
jgi:hypothetical protein